MSCALGLTGPMAGRQFSLAASASLMYILQSSIKFKLIKKRVVQVEKTSEALMQSDGCASMGGFACTLYGVFCKESFG